MKTFAFTTTILNVKKTTEDILFLTLTAPQDFAYAAGQFITLKIINRGETKLRSYSILSYEPGKIKLCIKLIPGGFASEIFAKTKQEDTFEVKGPFGHLIYDEASLTKESWFLGGGTGIVPLYNILAENLPKHPKQTFILLFSARTKKELVLDKEIKQLASKFTNFIYQPTLTREEWTGKTGRIPNHLPRDLKDKTFYICGTTELVLDIKNLLMKQGVNPKHIKFECYN
ncbi:MAG: FAD-binding oxidoreductase [Nanoarchaeota archaeon]